MERSGSAQLTGAELQVTRISFNKYPFMPARPTRLRVLRLVPVLDFGGVESRLILQSKLSSHLDLHVAAFWKPGAAAEQIRPHAPVHVLDVAPDRHPRVTARLFQLLRRLRPDVLHSSIAEANFHALIAGRLARVPVRIAEEVGMPKHGRVGRLAFRALYSQASAVVGVSQAVCHYLTDVDRAPRDRVRLIYNCAHPRYFPDPAPIPNPTDNLLMVGRLHEVKNHHTVLRAFAKIADKRPHSTLSIAGDGPLREEIVAQIRSLKLDGRVHLLGFRDDVQDLLQDAGAFVLASHSEGCSISLIEAMASGVFCLGSSVSGIQEVMGRLASRWTASSRDVSAWEKLLLRYFALSDSERTEVAREGQQRARQRFSPTRYVNDLTSMYNELTDAAS